LERSRFVDVDAATKNIRPTKVEAALTPRTKSNRHDLDRRSPVPLQEVAAIASGSRIRSSKTRRLV